jgi:hypothetical protein
VRRSQFDDLQKAHFERDWAFADARRVDGTGVSRHMKLINGTEQGHGLRALSRAE